MFATLQNIAAGPSIFYLLAVLFALAAVLGPLEMAFPARKQRLVPYRGMLLDVTYWFFTPLVTRLLTNYALGAILFGLYYLQGRALEVSLLDGFGPLSRQTLWIQALEILVIADFVDYWTHRLFHTRALWRIHAIHHSPEQMNWIASSRMHPLNDLVTRACQVVPVAMLGFSGRAILLIVPYLFFYVIFVHSNLKWSFGVFRYLLVSPAYHHWHHTSDAEGIDKNFAGIFPIWDILFGTCYLPGHAPKRYGVVSDPLPNSIVGHLIYPIAPVLHVIFRGASRRFLAAFPASWSGQNASGRVPLGPQEIS